MCCAVVIAGPSGPVRHMSFAPDSEQLAVTCSDGAVCIASTKTGDMLYEDAIQVRRAPTDGPSALSAYIMLKYSICEPKEQNRH